MGKTNVLPSGSSLGIAKEYSVPHFPCGIKTVTLQLFGKSKKWHPKLSMTNDRNFRLRGSWVNFVRENSVQEGDICLLVPTEGERFTFTVHILGAAASLSRGRTEIQSHGRTNRKKDSALHIEEDPTDGEIGSSESNRHGVSHQSLQTEDSDSPSEPHYILPHKTCLTHLQKKLVEENVQGIKSEFPVYVAIMSKYSVDATATRNGALLEFGSRYAAAYLPDNDQIIWLEYMGHIWQTKMNVYCKQSRTSRWFLSEGWSKFVRANHLRIGDICLFELKKNKQKLTMAVQIIFQ